MEDKKDEKRITSDDVFPQHLSIACMGHTVDIGSFDLTMYQLKEIALDCLREMKKIEGGE